MTKQNQTSETFFIGIILACVGDFLDAYSYLCRGGVFANAQTGNIVLFGMNIAAGKASSSVRYLLPILAFCVGIIIAQWMKNVLSSDAKIHWRQITTLLEILILLGVYFIPQSERLNLATNVMVSLACALQVQSFKKMNGNAFATTMCTGNLRSAVEHLYLARSKKSRVHFDRSIQYFGVIAFFIVGAALGTFLIGLFGLKSILFPCFALAAVVVLMFF